MGEGTSVKGERGMYVLPRLNEQDAGEWILTVLTGHLGPTTLLVDSISWQPDARVYVATVRGPATGAQRPVAQLPESAVWQAVARSAFRFESLPAHLGRLYREEVEKQRLLTELSAEDCQDPTCAQHAGRGAVKHAPAAPRELPEPWWGNPL